MRHPGGRGVWKALPLARQRIPFPRGLVPAVLRGSSWASGDPEAIVAEFESAAAKYLGVRHAIAVTSGREALALILQGLRLSPGSAVVVPAFTYHAVPAAVRDLGLRPVFADVDPRTFNLSPESLEECLGRHPETRLVLVTHTFGVQAPVAVLRDLCQKKGIPIGEDRAHEFLRGNQGNLIGVAGFHSLETSKPLSALGGGIAVTDDPDLADRMRRMVGAGRERAVEATRALVRQVFQALITWPPVFALSAYPAARACALVGRDLEDRRVDPARPVLGPTRRRLHGLHAAVGLAALDRLDSENEARIHLAGLLDDLLEPRVLRQRFERRDALWMFTLLPGDRDRLAFHLLRAGIDVKRDLLCDCSRLFGSDLPMPNAASVARRALHLPFHPWLGEADIRRMAEATNRLW
ncbi:MAG TPA: aminotransferase class I/II-fold pyridoxal phosphate-dependent enzyme [Myxococcota bacterium]|nr:aminotransferase class I/II-fold pyridoxal phosphate-dependent enzyme [Myxococcota bacterium]HQK51231.1 aminotransferase class I/II-fold pyridoxal phosphate-dependent enzyme [Myxococcota bacterium]